jgi:hypothetical protein
MREDGLYQITTSFFTAGFELFDGQVIACAPILKRNIDYWKHRGVYVTPSTDETRKKYGLQTVKRR